MPPSNGSVCFRARTNITSSVWLLAAGNFLPRGMVNVAQPSWPVGCSGGMTNWLYGVAVT